MSRFVSIAMLAWSIAPVPALAAQGQPGSEDAAGQPASTAPAAPADDAAELAKKLNNPIASLISLPFQENVDFGEGVTDDGQKMTLNIQPVIPISITKGTNLIVRTIVPVVWQDNLFGNNSSQFGLGDTVQSLFFSPKKPTAGGIIWGAGPVFLYPTGTDKFTTGKKWGAGPTFVVLKQFGTTTVGLLANHIWSVAGSNERPGISATFIQPFLAYTTKTAATFSINTESTYDWKSNQWKVPINALVSQLVRLGKQPGLVRGRRPLLCCAARWRARLGRPPRVHPAVPEEIGHSNLCHRWKPDYRRGYRMTRSRKP